MSLKGADGKVVNAEAGCASTVDPRWETAWMSREVRINGLFHLLIRGTWGYNPLILTIDPNFQRDIQLEEKKIAKKKRLKFNEWVT